MNLYGTYHSMAKVGVDGWLAQVTDERGYILTREAGGAQSEIVASEAEARGWLESVAQQRGMRLQVVTKQRAEGR